MQEPIKVAVVGVGHLGQHHARLYCQIPQVQLVAVADTDGQQAKKIAHNFATRAVADYRDLLGKVDAVSVATPTDTHFDIAGDFLRARTHVLVEKPMTKDVGSARELVAIAREHGYKLQVGHTERFNPAVMELVRRKVKPLYIEAVRMSPFRFRSGDISVVLDMMIHDIDLVRFFFDSPIDSVSAIGVNLLGRHVDLANARLIFASGATANVTANRVAPGVVRKVSMFTDSSYITLDYGTMQGKIYKKPEGLDLPAMNLQHSIPPAFAGLSFEEIFYGKLLQVEELSIKKHEPLYVELESFIRCIRENTVPEVSGEDGLQAMEIAHMVECRVRPLWAPV